MKKNFTTNELQYVCAHLTHEIPGMTTGGIIAVDLYGGVVNNPHLSAETATTQHEPVWSCFQILFHAAFGAVGTVEAAVLKSKLLSMLFYIPREG